MRNKLMKAEVAIMSTAYKLAEKFNAWEKENGDKALIIELILIVIAVILAIVFRDSIKTLITEFISSVKAKLNSLLGSAV